MNLFEKFLYFLQAEKETPEAYGWFHLLCIGIMISLIVFLFTQSKKYNEK